MINKFVYKTILGNILVQEKNSKIIGVKFINDDENYEKGDETELLRETIKEINEYLKGERKNFSVPILMEGTEFQKKVWKELQKIPYGQTRSYKEIAESVGKEKASRAVGMANSKNPIHIIVPCHRIIASNGSLSGFAGGIEIKKKLLKLEEENEFKRKNL